MPALGDITNRNQQAARPAVLPTKKPVVPLACLANLRSRVPAVLNDSDRERDDAIMQDADEATDLSSDMSIASAGSGNGDVPMASSTMSDHEMSSCKGDTTVSMRTAQYASARSSGREDECRTSLESILDESTALLKPKLEEASRNQTTCTRTKNLIDTTISFDTNSSTILDMNTLDHRDSSTRNISRVLGRGGFKLVLEEEGKALAVFLKQGEKDSSQEDLLAVHEILASLLLSAYHTQMPNFLQVDGIFRTDICRIFFPETTVAFRMEKCSTTIEGLLVDWTDQKADKGRLTLHQIEQYFFQICCALAYMHSILNIYHLDLKPSNIFLTSLTNGGEEEDVDEDGSGDEGELTAFQYRLCQKKYVMSLPKQMALVKIGDLGSSILGVETYDDIVSGTPMYRPPEYFVQGPYGPAGDCTDVWAVGLMMFESYASIDHVAFIEQKMDGPNDDMEDYLLERIETIQLCRMLYGYFVLFSTREDIQLFRRVDGVEYGWLTEAGSFATTFVRMLVEDEDFQEDWRRYSVQEGSDDSMIRFRSRLCEGGTNEDHPRLSAFLSMLSIDPGLRLTAAKLAGSSLFGHMEVSGDSNSSSSGEVVCRLDEELFR